MRAAIARAPGRVNLIGEHTDYNGGFVLPCAVPYETRVRIQSEPGRVLQARSVLGHAEFDPAHVPSDPFGDWRDYVRGVLAELQLAGVALDGAGLHISGNVPMRAGLSSSASLEVALALAVLHAAGASMQPLELAQLAQRAENGYTGTRCGIMDQFAVLFGREGHAVYLDTRSLEYELVAVPADFAIVIANTMTERELSAGAYNRRRAECEEAVCAIRERAASVEQLRDVAADDLPSCERFLPGTLFRRVRHVVTENARVQSAVRALRDRDIDALGAFMNASHESLRTDFEVSTPQLDLLAQLARTHGAAGARMTGGGFGGCIVAVAGRARAADLRERLARAYREQTGVTPDVYDGTPAAGASVNDG